MQFQIVAHPLPHRWRDGRTWSLAALTGAVALFAAAFVPSPAGAGIPGWWLPGCAFKWLTGLPCPLCGLTTAAAYLVRGELACAWRASALAPFAAGLFVLAVAYTCGVRLATGRRLELADRSARRAFWFAGGAIAAAGWGVNLLRHLG